MLGKSADKFRPAGHRSRAGSKGAGSNGTWLPALLLCVLFAPLACAQQARESGQSLTILVPRGPGGGSSEVANQMRRALEGSSELSVKVEHKPGGDGLDAVREFLRLPPDGNVILQHVDDLAPLFVEGELEAHPNELLRPLLIAQVTFSQIYVRRLETRFDDWPSFVQYARENPLRIAVVGHAFAKESYLLRKVGKALELKLEPVPFNNPADRYTSLVDSTVDALIEQPGDVRSLVQERWIRPIITLQRQVPDGLPEAFRTEATLQDVPGELPDLFRYRAFFVHPQTDEARVEELAETLRRAFESETFQSFNESSYMNVLTNYRGPQASHDFIADTVSRYQSLLLDPHAAPATAGG